FLFAHIMRQLVDGINEIVRRVDPKRRTIGQIVSEEILKQYDLEFYLLLPQSLWSRVSTFYHAPITEKIALTRQFLLEWWYKKNSDLIDPIDPIDRSKAFNNIPGIPHIFNFKGVTKLEAFTFECPSVTGITNANSMPKLGAIITNNGQPLDDNSSSKPLISKNTVDLISTKLPMEWDYIIRRNLTPSVGGFSYFKFPGLEDVEFLGWGGFWWKAYSYGIEN
ncbi:20476_t:CDS:1, partial [Gigaspora rosea]